MEQHLPHHGFQLQAGEVFPIKKVYPAGNGAGQNHGPCQDPGNAAAALLRQCLRGDLGGAAAQAQKPVLGLRNGTEPGLFPGQGLKRQPRHHKDQIPPQGRGNGPKAACHDFPGIYGLDAHAGGAEVFRSVAGEVKIDGLPAQQQAQGDGSHHQDQARDAQGAGHGIHSLNFDYADSIPLKTR